MRGTVQTVQFQGAATRVELALEGGEKLLVSQANPSPVADASLPRAGQSVTASWARAAMIRLQGEG